MIKISKKVSCRQRQEHNDIPIHELPHNLVASTLACLAQGNWNGQQAAALRCLTKMDLYVLGLLLKDDPALLHRALVDYKGSNFFASAKERVIQRPSEMIIKDVYGFRFSRSDPILEEISLRDNFQMRDIKILPIFPSEKWTLFDAIYQWPKYQFVDYNSMHALWFDYLEHAVDHSGVLTTLIQETFKKNEIPVKRIFCCQSVKSKSTLMAYFYINVGHSISLENSISLVEDGDFLLMWS